MGKTQALGHTPWNQADTLLFSWKLDSGLSSPNPGCLWRFHISPLDQCFLFWAHLCKLHGGLLCVAFCLSVCLGVPRAHYTPLRRYMGSLCTRTAQYAPLRRNMHHGAQGRLCFLKNTPLRVIISPRSLSVCRLSRADAVDRLLIAVTGRAHCQRQVAFLKISFWEFSREHFEIDTWDYPLFSLWKGHCLKVHQFFCGWVKINLTLTKSMKGIRAQSVMHCVMIISHWPNWKCPKWCKISHSPIWSKRSRGLRFLSRVRPLHLILIQFRLIWK